MMATNYIAMDFMRKHWYDVGGLFAICIGLFILQAKYLTAYGYVMWCSLAALFMHQLEEYRIAGTFPGMVNSVMYRSDAPDRFPLNTNTALCVNVYVGWASYLLAAILGEKAIWLGIATMLVSLGNTIAHTTVFNIRGKTWYNAGLATSWLFFVPCIYCFFTIIHRQHLVTINDYGIGLPMGIGLNIFGILKPIEWLADRNTTYIFEQRNLLPKDSGINE